MLGEVLHEPALPVSALPVFPVGAGRTLHKAAAVVIDGQARRLARWQARRDKLLAPTSDTGQRLAAYEKEKRLKGAKNMPAPNKPRSPLRVGRPPGHRARQRHEVDEVLADLNWLALDAIAPPDTS